MAKNLKEFIQCGRDPAYLKNGDVITEELAWEIVGQEGPEEEWISQGMQAEIAAAAKMGIEPQFIYIGKEKR